MTRPRTSRAVLASTVLVLAVVPACSEGTPSAVEFEDPEALTYDPALSVDLASMQKTGSGLYVKDVVVGTGDTAGSTDLAVIEYSGWTADGTLFDTSRQTGRSALSFRPADGGIIAGWIEGVVGMQVGGTRQLVIPPQLAYGDRSPSPLIPRGAVLVFELELVDLNPGG